MCAYGPGIRDLSTSAHLTESPYCIAPAVSVQDSYILRRRKDMLQMSSGQLWKYCTSDQVKEVLLSLHLLDGVPIKEEKRLACLYAVSNHTEKHYHSAAIPKKNGQVRRLFVPDPLLMRIQKNILRHVLAEEAVSEYATAYRAGSAVIENVRPHVGKKKILKLDIQGFFDHITFPLVYQYAFPAVQFPPAIRRLLTELCCYKDYLPQGAPTSPAISNLVMKPFDEFIGAWCAKRKITYTRYCDDLTFSGEFDEKEVKCKVRSYLEAMGFDLNRKKTRLARQCSRQTVTGIVVNEKPQVNREYRRQLRAELYYCRKYGVKSHLERIYGQKRQIEDEDCKTYLRQQLGKVNYVLQVNPADPYFFQEVARLKKELKE